MTKKISRISKSQYLKGVQCPKALWLYRHRPDLAPEISEAQQYIFNTGHEVGELAKKYFDGGVEIKENYYEIDRAIESTQKALERNESVIFEATAASGDGAFSRIDIFRKEKGTRGRDLIEVKSSTEIKDYYLDDITFQRYAFAGAGHKIRNSILMHLDKDYVRSGELDVKGLFSLEDRTAIVKEKMPEIRPRVRQLIQVLNSGTEPAVEIGDQCTNPFDCDYIPYCWEHVPEYSVYNVFNGGKLRDLLAENIIDVADVPDDLDMTDRQLIAVSAFKENRIHSNPTRIKEFLEQLKYPLYFLDYETIWPAVPLFDNARPYQQIPFQFSLHIQSKEAGALNHVEFLHTGPDDPRPAFIQALVESCGEKGSVVVYNQPFESRINTELARDFAACRSELEKINARMVDLLVPFRCRNLYHPAMKGSASLKSVLPAFVPEMSYEELAIQDGGLASIRYLECIKDTVSDGQKERIFNDLRKYCRQDTLAEVKLLAVLNKFS